MAKGLSLELLFGFGNGFSNIDTILNIDSVNVELRERRKAKRLERLKIAKKLMTEIVNSVDLSKPYPFFSRTKLLCYQSRIARLATNEKYPGFRDWAYAFISDIDFYFCGRIKGH